MDHIAIRAQSIEWYVRFFSDVFGTEIVKTNGEDQVWLSNGLQLNRSSGSIDMNHGLLDHIAIRTEDLYDCLRKARKYDIKTMDRGDNWIVLPTGLCIELLPLME